MDDAGDVDAAVATLLQERIGNFDQLQLLLLVAAARDRHLTLDELVHASHIPPDTASDALEALRRAGLLEAGDAAAPAWRLAPADAALAATIDRLETEFRRNPVSIMRLLTARSIERVRTAALLTFADAFVVGRKKDG